MKQVFATRPKAALPLALAAAAALCPAPVYSAPVRGRIEALPRAASSEVLGYTKTRVSGPSPALKAQLADGAVFLKVETSLPIPKPEQYPRVELRGLRLVPDVAACAVDGKVTFANLQGETVTLRLGQGEEVRLNADATYDYECTAGESLRRVRVKEWPHIRGLVYVGEVGVAGALDARGAFTLSAPDGKYELQVLNNDGLVTTKKVEVKGASVDVGTITLTPGTEAP
jgi:hypothetical protein